jgi:hypothetical protein
MDLFVTPGAQGEIPFGIITQPSARLNVMYLKFTHRSATLAAPPVSLQYFLPQFVVGGGIQP